jgi:membrane-bound lytic murein transglycosylase D
LNNDNQPFGELFSVFRRLLSPRRVWLVLVLALVAGCATTQKETRDYDPYALPDDAVAAEEPSTELRSVADLLRAADDAFQAANAAQEAGDQEEALRQYNSMLELLVKAELDPSVYYSLRNEFGRILGSRPDGTGEALPQWEEGMVAAGLPIPSPLNYRVEKEIQGILKGYPRNFENGLKRSQKYMPYIEAQLAKEGLPKELAWLAMVESQFTPKINSHAGAGGMWQFMPSTGRRYGLRIDRDVDERYDWQKATGAAIAYLKDLYAMFGGEWPLAISAYNMGEYGLERAIVAAGGERDIWTLIDSSPASDVIREETKCFYAKLLASYIVGSDPAKHGFSTEYYAPDNTVAVRVNQSFSLAALERACAMSNDTLVTLNPQFIHGVTPASGEYELRVPADAYEKLSAALLRDDVRYRPSPPPVQRSETQRAGTHTVRRGETLSHIAAHYKIGVQELMRANNISSARSLRAGRSLVVPGQGNESSATERANGPTATVKRGDTLAAIAQANNVSVKDLQQWNGMGDSTLVRTGETIVVAKESTPAPAAELTYHTVSAGDNPGKIAEHYNVRLSDLLEWNKLTRNSVIRVGDKLTVHGGNLQAVEQTQTPAGEDLKKVLHTVANGESPYTIAAQYGVATSDLLAWNELNQRSFIHVGDKLTIYLGDGAPVKLAALASEDAPAQQEDVTHVVTNGQSPWVIAKRYNVSVDDLLKWNGWDKNHVLRVGDKVVIKQ